MPVYVCNHVVTLVTIMLCQVPPEGLELSSRPHVTICVDVRQGPHVSVSIRAPSGSSCWLSC